MTDFIAFAARRHVSIVRTSPESIEVNGQEIRLWNVGDDLYRTISPLGLASARALSLAEIVCKQIDDKQLLRKWKLYDRQRERRRERNRKAAMVKKKLRRMAAKSKPTS